MGFMPKGKHITRRLLPALLEEICTELDIGMQMYSDDWVLRLAREEQVSWVYGYHFDLNTGAVSEIANDKVATYLILEAADVRAVPHYLLRSAANEGIVVDKIKKQIPGAASPFVVKPLSGSSGHSVHYVAGISEGVEIVLRSRESGWTASPYEKILKEYRVVMLDAQAELVYEKVEPLIKGNLRLFNLGLGARAKDVRPTTPMHGELAQLAARVCSAMRFRVAAVDIIQIATGELKVLEVNSGISFEYYGRQSPEKRDKAKTVYEKIVKKMMI